MELEVEGCNDPSLVEFFREFFGEYEKVIIKSSRVVSYSERIGEPYFYIYERAIPSGNQGGRYHDRREIVIGGNRLTNWTRERKTLICDGVGDENVRLLLDDEGVYVASIVDNILMICCELSDFDVDSLKTIFEMLNIVQLTPMDRVFAIMRRMGEKSEYDTKIKGLEVAIGNQERTLKHFADQFKEATNLVRKYRLELDGLYVSRDGKDIDVIEQLERLLQSKSLESLTMEGDRFLVCTTKILRIGPWRIGRYILRYNVVEGGIPYVKRIYPVATNDNVLVPSNCEHERTVWRDKDHPHISMNVCTGNFTDVLKSFWSGDYLSGFNFFIQFLRSYSAEDPYCGFEEWLTGLGYVTDGKILREHGRIVRIDDGKMYNRDDVRVTGETLRTWGITGRLDPPSTLEQYYVNSQFHKRYVEGRHYVQPDYDGSDGDTTCGMCHEAITSSRLRIFSGSPICDHCWEEHTRRCETCLDRIYTDDGIIHNEEWYCESCFRETFSLCDGCDEHYTFESMSEHDGASYCQDCYRDVAYVECEKCGERIHRDNMVEEYCNPCYESIRLEQEEQQEEGEVDRVRIVTTDSGYQAVEAEGGN